MATKITKPKIIFAGDRDIAVSVLKFIIKQGVKPTALLVSQGPKASHAAELRKACSHLKSNFILAGDKFRTKVGLKLLQALEPDYLICVHFPYIIPDAVLEIPKIGVLNLHPAFLPFNRGWHTPSWAIYEKTPYGATLHFMDKDIDTGDIIHQKKIEVKPEDTADSLYRKVKKLELEVFKEAWPKITKETYRRKPQPKRGTFHRSQDLKKIQKIDFEKTVKAGDLIRKLKALTTNNLRESAYFCQGGRVYHVQVRIKKEKK